MPTDEEKREALLKKLQSSAWKAKTEEQYDRIVGADIRFPIILDMRLPAYHEIVELAGGSIPVFDEPTTIDGLWLDRWQRSSGAYTITRMPDESIRFDYPTGEPYTYRVVRSSNNGYTWTAEQHDLAGRRIHSRRSTDRYDTRDEAAFEMHRAVLAEFDDLTNEY